MVQYNAVKESERVLIHISDNVPSSMQQAKQFPKENFPIHLNLLFAKRYAYLVDELKAALDGLPKDSFRFRKKVNPYAGVSVNIYFKEVDAMRPLLPWLKEKELYRDVAIGKDEKLLPYQILDKARAVIQQKEQAISA